MIPKWPYFPHPRHPVALLMAIDVKIGHFLHWNPLLVENLHVAFLKSVLLRILPENASVSNIFFCFLNYLFAINF